MSLWSAARFIKNTRSSLTSQEEFLEFYGLRLKAKFAEFLEKEGWRKLSPRHGYTGEEEAEYDSGGGGDDVGRGARGGGGGTGAGRSGEGEGGGAAVPESDDAIALKVDGKMVRMFLKYHLLLLFSLSTGWWL